MMRLHTVLSIARAEMRLTRRLVRYWVFLIISYLFGIGGYLYYSVIHGLFSSHSATIGSLNPRFLVNVLGFYYFTVFMVGIVFLGFDIRARDRRERIIEVLDSLPYTNLELVTGRFLGLLWSSWIPVVLLAAIWELLGLLLAALGSPVGEPLGLNSLFTFAFFMMLPGFSLVLALAFLVTLLVRNRLVAALVLLMILGVDFWAVLALPLYCGSLLDFSGMYVVDFPSEIVPGIADTVGWLQRTAALLTALGTLGLSAAIHPRLDGGSRARTAASALGVLAAGVFLAGFGFFLRSGDLEMIERWRGVHAARADVPVPDLTSISGEVKIAPGTALKAELDLSFRAPAEKPIDTALFTLNPGQTVLEVQDAAGRPLAFTHEDGLLAVNLPTPLAPGTETKIRLSLGGLPDRRFAYLYSARTPEETTAVNGQLFLLGFEPMLFDERFVALMPGVRWLPAPGPEKGRDDPSLRALDFFDINLLVEVPSGWLVAGPGRRQDVAGAAGGARFRFAPPAPVPEVALIASEFESQSVEIEGVLLEVLVHPSHARNLEVFADAAEEIRTWIEERLREAREAGLGYPYGGLTSVEVPVALRGYAGGWRMDTTLAPPAMVLMRESGFPTARFDSAFRNPENFKDYEGGLPRAKRDRLRNFFTNDFSGGNPFIGAARSFFAYQTAAKGSEGLALNYVMETLSTSLVMESRGYFSAHLFKADANQAVNRIMRSFVMNQAPGRTFADAVIEALTSRPEVWDTVLGVALVDLDPWEDPARTVDVLTLKGGAVSQSLLDGLGRDKTFRLLASLREAHVGRSFSFEDLIAAGKALDEDLQELLGDWLGSTDLPGFVGSGADAYRLPDDDDGSPRYQLLVTVRNDEPVPGIFRILYWIGSGGEREGVKSDPIRLQGRSAVRFAVIVSRPPTAVQVEPYLSLNRAAFVVPLKSVDQEKIMDRESLEGLAEQPWKQPDEDFIVVDDLDEGFYVTEGEERKGLRLGARRAETETDQGLPSRFFGTRPSVWSRMVNPRSWGKYRHTLVAVRAGAGSRRATFSASIPRPGSWDLELHMTAKKRFFQVRKWGVWHLEVVNDSGRREVTFDSDAGTQGWNLVGTFELTEGETLVELSDKTNGQLVVADAIRWSPSAGKSSKEQE